MYNDQVCSDQPQRFNSFMVLSLCFGILSFLSCSVIFFSLIAGGMSILFAILSKGSDTKLKPLSRLGILTSIFGIFCSFAVTIGACYLFFTNDYYHEQINQACKEVYQQSFDDMMLELYPNLSQFIEKEGM